MLKKMVILCVIFIGFVSENIAQQVVLDWVKSIGVDGGFHEGHQILKDKEGNIYTVGKYYKTTDFDPGTGEFKMKSGLGNIYILKLTPNGEFIKAQKVANSDDVRDPSLALDKFGNLYISGRFEYTVDFDPSSAFVLKKSNGKHDAFVLKLDTGWNFKWVRTFGSHGEERISQLILDDNGSVIVTGNFEGNMDIDPSETSSQLLNFSGSRDVFVQKLDSLGNFQWGKAIGGTGTDGVSTLSADSENNIYVIGGFESTVDFDPGPNTLNKTSMGKSDIFIQKLDSKGELAWVKTYGGKEGDAGSVMTIAEDNSIYLGGIIGDTVYFGSSIHAAPIGANFVILKIDTAGTLEWVNSVAHGSTLLSTELALDQNQNLYLTGSFWGYADFISNADTHSLKGQGKYDGFVSKIDSAGSLKWVKAFGGSDYDVSYSVYADHSGGILLTGYYGRKVDFNPNRGVDTLTALGYKDIFIMKLNQCESSSGLVDTFSCSPYMWNGSTFVNSGIYHDTFANLKGCDSTVILKLSVQNIDTSILILSGDTLKANESGGARYQWLNCDNNQPISGDTNQLFVPKESGNYAVRISKGKCSAISTCYRKDITGISSIHSRSWFIYPNPTTGKFTIRNKGLVSANHISITNILGKNVTSGAILLGLGKTHLELDLAHLPPGLYNVNINGFNLRVSKI